MFSALIILSLVGICLSFYAFLVERLFHTKKDYHALCDISENISCTKAFSSPTGKLLKFSNSLGGLIYYTLIIILVYLNQFQIILYFSVLALAGSIYLAYISYIKMKNFCLVCTAVYIINILIFLQLI
ncbi:MAG: vitamin K epoxide reductase family protein [Nanoarchaeota archaeon]|nr:vitamin K epoxide reductase family protein [Nanoarchaeota archaeon]